MAYPHNNYHCHMHHLARQFLIGVSVPSKRSFFYPSAAVEAAVSMRIFLFYLGIRMTVCKHKFILSSLQLSAAMYLLQTHYCLYNHYCYELIVYYYLVKSNDGLRLLHHSVC